MNKQKVINGITGAFAALAARMEKMGKAGATVANGMMNVSGAVDKTATILGRLVSAFTIGGSAVLAFFAMYQSSKENAKQFDKQLEKNKQTVEDFGAALKKSFVQDRTLVGKNVLSDITKTLDETMRGLQQTAEDAPNMWDHITDYFVNTLDRQKISKVQSGIAEIDALFSDSAALNERQAIGASADRAQAALQELSNSGVDLAKKISGTDTEYREFVEGLRSTGKTDAANELDKIRAKFTQIEKDMRQLGPAGAEILDDLS